MLPISLPPPAKDRFFSAIDPFDSRYYEPEIARYLSEEARITYQAYVEAALAHTLAEFGICSKKIAKEIELASHKVTARGVQQEEEITKHDIKALVNCLKNKVSKEASVYVHFGATSYDIVANAAALQIRETINKVIIPRLINLENNLISLAERYADTTQIGRTHGQHALPITFGFTLAEYVSRLGDSLLAIKALSEDLPGKFSGAVGAYNSLSLFVDDPLKFEVAMLKRLKLKPAPYSTQILPPESTIRLLDELTITAGIMANLSHDMRHLQRTEIAEVREYFKKDQTGSSTMAHKRNPWNFENIVSMSKQVLAQCVNANLNIASEHQRDLTDSASARFYPITLAAIASMAKRLSLAMSKLEVDEANMQRNLKMSLGAIAAEPLYLLLAKYGHSRAHEKVKEMAHQALDSGISLLTLISSDPELKKFISRLTDQEKATITYPEKFYTGLAAQKTKQIASKWKKQIKTIPTP